MTFIRRPKTVHLYRSLSVQHKFSYRNYQELGALDPHPSGTSWYHVPGTTAEKFCLTHEGPPRTSVGTSPCDPSDETAREGRHFGSTPTALPDPVSCRKECSTELRRPHSTSLCVHVSFGSGRVSEGQGALRQEGEDCLLPRNHPFRPNPCPRVVFPFDRGGWSRRGPTGGTEGPRTSVRDPKHEQRTTDRKRPFEVPSFLQKDVSLWNKIFLEREKKEHRHKAKVRPMLSISEGVRYFVVRTSPRPRREYDLSTSQTDPPRPK